VSTAYHNGYQPNIVMDIHRISFSHPPNRFKTRSPKAKNPINFAIISSYLPKITRKTQQLPPTSSDPKFHLPSPKTKTTYLFRLIPQKSAVPPIIFAKVGRYIARERWQVNVSGITFPKWSRQVYFLFSPYVLQIISVLHLENPPLFSNTPTLPAAALFRSPLQNPNIISMLILLPT